MPPYSPNTTRLTVPFYGTRAMLENLRDHVKIIASVPGSNWLFASDDNDKPAEERLRFRPKELIKALGDAIRFCDALLSPVLPTKLEVTEAELMFLNMTALNYELTLQNNSFYQTMHDKLWQTFCYFYGLRDRKFGPK